MPVTPEDRKRYQTKWQASNPEKAKEVHRKAQLKWRAKNRERVRNNQRQWNTRNREKANLYRKKQYYKQKYGMTQEERDALVSQQGGCAVCQTKTPGNRYGWVIDHCHNSSKVRGILCHHCNLALGNVRDDVNILLKLIGYLNEHSTANQD